MHWLAEAPTLVNPDDRRAFLSVTLQVLPFLFLAAVVEGRAPRRRPRDADSDWEHKALRDDLMGSALIMLNTLATLVGVVACISGLATDPVKRAYVAFGIAALLLSTLTALAAVLSAERVLLTERWRGAAPRARALAVGTALGAAAACVVIGFAVTTS